METTTYTIKDYRIHVEKGLQAFYGNDGTELLLYKEEYRVECTFRWLPNRPHLKITSSSFFWYELEDKDIYVGSYDEADGY